jgi:3-oxoacyl-[acyl-carrier-protein] synthase-3
MQAKITAIGAYAPEQIIDNHYFEGFIETSDEWIQSRTGIKTRHFARQNEYTGDLSEKAALNLAKTYGKDLSDVDFILLATVSHDHVMPSVAAVLQHRLGIRQAGALDIAAACAGFGYGIALAKSMVESGMQRKVLVIGAEVLSKVIDYSDRTSCILFGDGAGAVLVEASEQGNIGGCIVGAEGSGGQDLYLSNQSTMINGEPIKASGKIYQNGRKVFKWAVNRMTEQAKVLLEKNNLTIDDIDWFVPHSANMRIIEAICKGIGLPVEKALESVSIYGNTSSASIPLALNEGVKAGKVKKGDKVMLLGFGGGLSYAGTVVEWGV